MNPSTARAQDIIKGVAAGSIFADYRWFFSSKEIAQAISGLQTSEMQQKCRPKGLAQSPDNAKQAFVFS